MISISYIRDLYKPIQPTIRQSGADVTYQEFLPSALLQNFIYCYWELRTTKSLSEPFHYRVVADGCIDIFFDLNNTKENFVLGFCKKYTEFPLENSFRYFGIRFLPTMFPQSFQVDAKTLSNRAENLINVVPEISNYISDNFDSGQSCVDIRKKFDAYFEKAVQTVTINNDNRLYDAIKIILQKSGVVNIESDIDTGISARQLRRMFEFYIGDTAKTFSKVVRFQNILRAKPSVQSLNQNKLFFEAGYYDQAHFIKEFKNFYGVTPGKAFGR